MQDGPVSGQRLTRVLRRFRRAQRGDQGLVFSLPVPDQETAQRFNIGSHRCRQAVSVIIKIQQVDIHVTAGAGHLTKPGKFTFVAVINPLREHILDLGKGRAGAANRDPKIMQKFGISSRASAGLVLQ